MATTKVKVLKPHTIGRMRMVGATYLLDSRSVDYCVKVGLVEVVKAKKKRNESSDSSK